MASLALDDLTRITLAKERTGTLVDNAATLIALFEANEVIVFSDMLSKQIPHSHTAVAFNIFQESSFMYEVIRLCTFWDSRTQIDVDIQSIPTVIQLVDSQSIIDALRMETWSAHARRTYRLSNPSVDPELRAIAERTSQHLHDAFAERQAQRAEQRLRTAIKWSKTILASDRLIAMKNFRDKYLAHSLAATRRDKVAAAAGLSVAKMKYSDARWLYRRTLAIIDNLHTAINGAGFNWSDSVRISRRNARSLWMNCNFDLKSVK